MICRRWVVRSEQEDEVCDIEMSELPCWLWRLNSAAGADIIGVRCSRLETAASPSDLVTSLLSLSLSLLHLISSV